MFKLIIFVIITAILIVYLKSINSEYAFIITIVAGLMITIFSLNYISETFKIINDLINLTGVNKEFYIIILKITAIGYLVEFAADTVSDFGLKSLGDKLIFAGKLLIFTMSVPIIYALINLLTGLLQ